MAQRIGCDIDVSGLLVEIGRERTAEFVGRDPLRGDRGGRVFFDQALDGADRDPLSFSGDKECIQVLRGDFSLMIDVVLQCLPHRLVKIDVLLLASLAEDPDPLFAPVNVLKIDPDQLTDAHAGVQ